MNMQIIEPCYHCHEKVPTGGNFTLILHKTIRHFCCPACLAITETIHNSGLDSYYQQRDIQTATGTAIPKRYNFSHWDNKSLQSEFIKHDSEKTTATLYIEGLHCTACAWLIEKHLLKIHNIISAQVNFQQQRLIVNYKNQNDSTNAISISKIMNAIAAIGYTPHPYQANSIKELQLTDSKKSLKQIGITAILMMQIGMFSIAIYAGEFVGITPEFKKLLSMFSLVFSIPLLYFSALPFFTSAFIRLKNRQINIDVSISIAIIGLYISSVYSVIQQRGDFYFDSIAMFCLLILIARYIEKNSRLALLLPNALLPTFTNKVVDGKIETIPLTEIHSGDMLLVREGDIIPIDGVVHSGCSSVSEAFLTGEPNPLVKKMHDNVFAGSQNHDGVLYITVLNEPGASIVKKIEALSLEAADDKPQQKSMTDTIAAKFTFTIYTLAIGTFIYWHQLGNPQAFWIALSVLVISCPCALSLAAPTALSATQFALRKKGILIQSPHVIESLNKINRVIFDKTGTLTEGKYTITQLKNTGDKSDNECLQIAHALEANSRHPIASAFSDAGMKAQDIVHFPNRGIEGHINGVKYRIGSAAFCQKWHPQCQNISENPCIGLCNETQFLAWFELSDTLRSDAKSLVESFQCRLVECEILSGDSSKAVDEIAQTLNIENVSKGCTAQEKLQKLQEHQINGEQCLMLGDGVNDAPTLSQSLVSATLLNACDWVKNSADIILLNNNLLSLAYAFDHAERYKKILRQNFTWAFLYNSLTIPLAMAGYVTPYFAAIGMSLSSIVVVLNSRRLKRVS